MNARVVLRQVDVEDLAEPTRQIGEIVKTWPFDRRDYPSLLTRKADLPSHDRACERHWRNNEEEVLQRLRPKPASSIWLHTTLKRLLVVGLSMTLAGGTTRRACSRFVAVMPQGGGIDLGIHYGQQGRIRGGASRSM
jgi:hypothetical protein